MNSLHAKGSGDGAPSPAGVRGQVPPRNVPPIYFSLIPLSWGAGGTCLRKNVPQKILLLKSKQEIKYKIPFPQKPASNQRPKARKYRNKPGACPLITTFLIPRAKKREKIRKYLIKIKL
jgi:hypothetical protein